MADLKQQPKHGKSFSKNGFTEFLDSPTLDVGDIDDSAIADEHNYALWTSHDAKRAALAVCKDRQRKLPDLLNGEVRWQTVDPDTVPQAEKFVTEQRRKQLDGFLAQIARAGVARVACIQGASRKSLFGYRVTPLDERDLIQALGVIEASEWSLHALSGKSPHRVGPVFFPDRVIDLVDYGTVYNVSVHGAVDEQAATVNTWIKRRAFLTIEAGLRWATEVSIPVAATAVPVDPDDLYINTEGPFDR